MCLVAVNGDFAKLNCVEQSSYGFDFAAFALALPFDLSSLLMHFQRVKIEGNPL
jgi:hypothetical protein